MERIEKVVRGGQSFMIFVGIVTAILFFIIGGIIGILIAGNALIAEIKRLRVLSDKHLALFVLCDRWLELRQKGKSIKQYLDRKGFNKVAIYGMGRLGQRFYLELKQQGVDVPYVIDRNGLSAKLGVTCLSPESKMPSVDVIIVTAICDFDEIKENMRGRVLDKIISLEEIILDCNDEDTCYLI